MSGQVDYRAAQTPIRQQGPRRTCAVFAATAGHEWMAGDQPDLSEEFALWVAKRYDPWPDQEATSVAAVLIGIGQRGQALTTDWPYGQPRWSLGPPAAAMVPNRRRRPGSWEQIGATWAAIDAALRSRAVMLSLRMQPTVWRQAASTGHVDHDDAAPVVDAHAVLAVGLIEDDRATDWVLVKNSWGVGWGAAGYGYVSGDYLDHHLLAAHALDPA